MEPSKTEPVAFSVHVKESQLNKRSEIPEPPLITDGDYCNRRS